MRVIMLFVPSFEMGLMFKGLVSGNRIFLFRGRLLRCHSTFRLAFSNTAKL